MKQLLLIAAVIAATSCGSRAQDFYKATPKNEHYRQSVETSRYKEQNKLMSMTAYMAVLQDNYRDDLRYHCGRPPRSRRHRIYYDNLAIQRQQDAINHTRNLLLEYDAWLKSF